MGKNARFIVKKQGGTEVVRTIYVPSDKPFALYVSSGENSDHPGTVFPFFRISNKGNQIGLFQKPCHLFDQAYVNVAWSATPKLIIDIEDVFKPDKLYAQAHDLMLRYGTPEMMCLSAAVGGGIWATEQGAKLHNILDQHFDLKAYIDANKEFIASAQNSLAVASENPEVDFAVEETQDEMTHLINWRVTDKMAERLSDSAHNPHLAKLEEPSSISVNNINNNKLRLEFLVKSNFPFLRKYAKQLNLSKHLVKTLDGIQEPEKKDELLIYIFWQLIKDNEEIFLGPVMAPEQKTQLAKELKSYPDALVIFDDNTVCAYRKGVILPASTGELGITITNRLGIATTNETSTSKNKIGLISLERLWPKPDKTAISQILRAISQKEQKFLPNAKYSSRYYRLLGLNQLSPTQIAQLYFDPKSPVLFAPELIKRPAVQSQLLQYSEDAITIFRNNISLEVMLGHENFKLLKTSQSPMSEQEWINRVHRVFDNVLIIMNPIGSYRLNLSINNDVFDEEDICSVSQLESFSAKLKHEAEVKAREMEIQEEDAFPEREETMSGYDQSYMKIFHLLYYKSHIVQQISYQLGYEQWPELPALLKINPLFATWFSSLSYENQQRFQKTWDERIDISTLVSQIDNNEMIKKLRAACNELFEKKLPLLISFLEAEKQQFLKYMSLTVESITRLPSSLTRAQALEVLGLPESTDDFSKVKASYHAIALDCHPDKLSKALGQDEIAKREHKFKLAMLAYNTLSKSKTCAVTTPLTTAYAATTSGQSGEQFEKSSSNKTQHKPQPTKF